MKPDERFLKQDKSFWAHVRTISQQAGYTDKSKKAASDEEELKAGVGRVKIPTLAEVIATFKELGLTTSHLINESKQLTEFGDTLFAYFKYRADILNTFVERHLMELEQARQTYTELHEKLSPTRPTPMNKQKGSKRAPAYFTGIINMLIEAN